MGVQPLTYQWFNNGTSLIGETNAALHLPNRQPGDFGKYQAVICNNMGCVTTAVMVVSVSDSLPFIVNQPTSQTSLYGTSARFEVIADGSFPLSYQWLFNATEIAAQTNAVLMIDGLKLQDAGEYSVIVSNAFGTVVSSNARLHVNNVRAWGHNNYGQTNVPLNLIKIEDVAAGYAHSLVLQADGTVRGWGNNSYGQTNPPANLSNVVAIAAGSFHSLALQSNGRVRAWGDNFYGQTNVPSNLSNVVAIAAGGNFNLALLDNGTVRAWGSNSSGQMNVPSGLSDVVAIAAGGGHSLVLLADGTLRAWGYNNYGQINLPSGLSNVVAIASGDSHNLALLSDGTVRSWGFNIYGQADEVPSSLPQVVAISAGNAHSLVLLANGTIRTWGNNYFGQTNVPENTSNVVAIAAGNYHNLALLSDDLFSPFRHLTNPLRAGNTFAFSAETQSGKVYLLQFKDSLLNTNWTSFPLVPGNGKERGFIDPNASFPMRFYRIRQW